MTADVAEVLRDTHLLRSVPAPDLERVLAVSRLQTFRRGQVVFTRGDPGDTLIVVVSGQVKVVVRAADGSELTLTIVAVGGTIGELSIADGGPRSADAETLCHADSFDPASARRLCSDGVRSRRPVTVSIT